MGLYRDQVLPRFTNVLLDSKDYGRVRDRVASRLSGEVLEVGFGSGLNVPYYPASVRRVRAVDPAAVGRKLAAKRVAASAVPVEYVGLDGQRLPLESESVDHVLVTWTMCTIPDVDEALREMHRVLRAGGQVHFAEHGLSPDAKVAKWQHRLDPIDDGRASRLTISIEFHGHGIGKLLVPLAISRQARKEMPANLERLKHRVEGQVGDRQRPAD